MVTVWAPATSANLGSGFDVFGVALDRPADVVRAERADRTTLEVTGKGSEYIPEEPDENTAGVVARKLDVPARIRIDKGVRPASGLGSSAASAVGTGLALNELYDLGYTREELVPVAAEGERAVSGDAHQDNVAPALLGGFTAATGDAVQHVPADVPLVVCLPDVPVSTREARAAVPDTADMDDVVDTIGAGATLVLGMVRDDPALVGRGTAETVVTPARAKLIDGYDRVHEAALSAGAFGATVSGAGPGVLAVCPENGRRRVAAAMVDAFRAVGVESVAYQTRVGEGARLYPDHER
jgi:homoserine kinase